MTHDELMDAVRHNLRAVVYQSGLSIATVARLRRDEPDGEWSFMGEVLLHQDTVWLHFAESNGHRLFWVMVEEEDEPVCMTWNMNEISDLC